MIKSFIDLKQMQGISGEMVIMTDCGSVVPCSIHGLSIFTLFSNLELKNCHFLKLNCIIS